MANGLLKYVRDKWAPVWAQPRTKSAFVLVGTVLGVGLFFYPMVRTLRQAQAGGGTDEMYSQDRLYPIQLRKQQEQSGKDDKHKI